MNHLFTSLQVSKFLGPIKPFKKIMQHMSKRDEIHAAFSIPFKDKHIRQIAGK